MSEQSRSFYFSESVCKTRGSLALDLEWKQANFVAHVRESEKNLIEDLIFERSTRSPLNVNTRVRFYNILSWFPLFLVALFCLIR